MHTRAKEEAERLFRHQEKGTSALQEYRAKQETIRARTADLRALRLAREAGVKADHD